MSKLNVIILLIKTPMTLHCIVNGTELNLENDYEPIKNFTTNPLIEVLTLYN